MEQALFDELGLPDPHDIERGGDDGAPPWPLHPVNTWLLVKGVAYFVCALSFFDAAGNVCTLVGWAYYGNWAAFVVSLCFMATTSCITTVAAAVSDHGTYGAADRAQDRGLMDSDGTKHGAAMAFFKLGAFRIAWRTMWYLDRAEIMAAAGTWTDEDLCEHLLPLFMFVASQAMVESWPILLIKCYVLGRNHGTTGGEGDLWDHPVLAVSTAVSIALLAVIPMFVDKISCDFRQVYVRGDRATALGKRFLGIGRCGALFVFRCAEAFSWYASLVLFAWVFQGWFWMIWAADLIALSCIYCTTADIGEEDWEVALAIKIFFQVFYTAPQHSESSDVVVFFRPLAPSRFSGAEPTYFPAALHFLWRLVTQGIIVLCIYTAGRDDWLSEEQWEDLQPWVAGTASVTAFMWLLLPVMCWCMPSSESIIAGIVERKYLLHSQRPEGVPEELYQAVVEQETRLYAEHAAGQPFAIRAWVIREHAMRANPYGVDRFPMTLRRDNMVEAVLDSVHTASQAQLRRGPRVTFSDDGEIGDDQGGVTREMFAEMARRCAAPQPGEVRLLKATAANRVQPEPCVPMADSGDGSTQGAKNARDYRSFGRVCGMALWTSELLDVTFAPYFLKRVIDPDRHYSLEENGADLSEEDPELWRSLSGMLKAAEASTDKGEELGLTFERTISASEDADPDAAGAPAARTVELVEGGSEIPVTHENAELFVEKYLHHKMSLSILPQVRAFREGLLDVLGDELLLTMFTGAELQQLLGGTDAIDTDALQRWRRDTTLSDDARGNENIVDFFWQSLDVMSEDERGKVLAFATGCPRMPLGPRGPTFVLNLHPHEDPNALPTAHTCTNTMNLPPYDTDKVMLEKLRVAINVGISGFGLA